MREDRVAKIPRTKDENPHPQVREERAAKACQTKDENPQVREEGVAKVNQTRILEVAARWYDVGFDYGSESW